MTDTKLTRTQQKYFEQYTQDILTVLFKDASEGVETNAILSMIDFKDFGKRFGEAVLSHCSFSDIKAADKAFSDPAIIRATQAIEFAIASLMPSKEEATNIQFMASAITSGVFKDDQFIDTLSEASEEVQDAVISKLLAKE